jgi:hypothetical protein
MADRYFSTEEEAIQDLVRRGLVVNSGQIAFHRQLCRQQTRCRKRRGSGYLVHPTFSTLPIGIPKTALQNFTGTRFG